MGVSTVLGVVTELRYIALSFTMLTKPDLPIIIFPILARQHVSPGLLRMSSLAFDFGSLF